MRSFFPKCLLHLSFLIFIGMLFQVLGPRKSIVFCEKLVVASSVARFCDCLVLYLCMSLFSVNKSLNIFGSFIVSLLVHKFTYTDFFNVFDQGISEFFVELCGWRVKVLVVEHFYCSVLFCLYLFH